MHARLSGTVLTAQNKDVVAQAEKIISDFKPKTYDVAAQLKSLDSFEATAVR